MINGDNNGLNPIVQQGQAQQAEAGPANQAPAPQNNAQAAQNANNNVPAVNQAALLALQALFNNAQNNNGPGALGG